MRWQVRQAITRAGRPHNEDQHGAAGRLAWVLDGAGLGRAPRVSGFTTDAEWFVTEISRVLRDVGMAGQSLDGALDELARRLPVAFGAPDVDDPAGGPTACLVLAEVQAPVSDGRVLLDIAVIGDCAALVPATAGTVTIVTDQRVVPFEAKTFAALAAGGGRTDATLPEGARAQIRANRAVVNQPDGFAVVSPTRAWRHLVLRSTATLAPDASLVLASDGATRLYDLFATCTATAFHAAAAAGQTADLIDALRALERADAVAATHPRFKIHDDATILVVAPDA